MDCLLLVNGGALKARRTPALTATPAEAVISSGKPGEGTNGGFCHPRKATVAHLTTSMGGAGLNTIKAFDSEVGRVKCASNTPANWQEVPANDRIWSTAPLVTRCSSPRETALAYPERRARS